MVPLAPPEALKDGLLRTRCLSQSIDHLMQSGFICHNFKVSSLLIAMILSVLFVIQTVFKHINGKTNVMTSIWFYPFYLAGIVFSSSLMNFHVCVNTAGFDSINIWYSFVFFNLKSKHACYQQLMSENCVFLCHNLAFLNLLYFSLI